MCMTKSKMCVGHKRLGLSARWGIKLGSSWRFGFNLVNTLLGSMPAVEKAVYILVGLSAVMMLLAGKCKKCGGCCGGDKACDGEQGGGSCCTQDGEHKM